MPWGVTVHCKSRDIELRTSVLETCRALSTQGLSFGSSGNVSVRRNAQSFFVSPSGMAYCDIQISDVPLVDIDGQWYGTKKPSSEWRFHRDVFKVRSEVNAIVHTHSRYATALACNGTSIPAFHYMVAVAGGEDIRCAPYATFGSQELSNHAVAALDNRNACLLAHHGVIALGSSAEAALALAGEVENLAAQYCAAIRIGKVPILDTAEMQRVLEKFRTYGDQNSSQEGGDLAFAGADIPGDP